MLEQINILKYEYHINPGQYFILDTSFVERPSDIKNIIIDQDSVFTKMLTVYPNNFVMYLEQTPDLSVYRTNKPIYQADHGDYYVIDFEQE